MRSIFKRGSVLPSINCAFQLLRTRVQYAQPQTVPIRKIVDRIRNSLELRVVLQTAVEEVATQLKLDECSFLWYFPDRQQIQVVCDRTLNLSSQVGDYPLECFGAMAEAIATGRIIINTGTVKPKRSSVFSWLTRILAKRMQEQVTRWCSWGNLLLSSPLDKPEKTWRKNEQHSAVATNCPLFGYKASLLIPVTGRDDSIGFIACLSQQPRYWLTDEMEFLQSIVEPLEIAIRQAQLYEQTQQQAIREQLVNQITSQTRQSFNPETILTEAIAQLLAVMQVDRCLVHLVATPDAIGDDGGEEKPAPNFSSVDTSSWNSPSSIPNLNTGCRRNYLYEVCRPPFIPSIDSFDPQGPITQWAIQHRQLVIIPDIFHDERIDTANAEYQNAQIKSSLVVPVQANDTLYALLYLNQCSHIRYWTKDEQKLAQAVADQLAISLQQAYLYARTQQQAQHNAMQAQQMAQMLEELRLTQAQLIQNEKMTSLGRTVAGVAHEINNPVSFIYGNIPYIENYINDLMRLIEAYQAYYPQSPAPLQRLIEDIQLDFIRQDFPKIIKSMESGAERIQAIVQLLQKFARHNEAPIKLVDLNAALESTLLIVHNQLTNTIQVERKYDNLPLVECYPKPINQAFLSILTNAIEALNRSTKPHKTLTLQTKWIPTDDISDGGQVQIIIADNGPGILPEIQPRIFEPFFTTKDVGQGRGLGLSVSYQAIVNQHKGQIEVRSQLNQGAEFLVEIPVRHHQSLTTNSSEYNSRSAIYPAKPIGVPDQQLMLG